MYGEWVLNRSDSRMSTAEAKRYHKNGSWRHGIATPNRISFDLDAYFFKARLTQQMKHRVIW
jgi:hypothetical protein